MTTITHVRDCCVPKTLGTSYEQLLSTMGTAGFGAAVQASIDAVTTGARRLYLFEATSRRQSSLHYFSCEPELVALLPAYRKHYLSKDPVGDAYGAATRCGDLVVQRIRPSDIGDSGFRRRFFDDAGIVERVSLIQRGSDGWRAMNLARHVSHGRCSDDEIDALAGLASLVLPMLANSRVKHSQAQVPSIAQLEQRFAELDCQLTPRERQVCARAAQGMSVDATARELGIANSSVLTFRQRAYQRLRVGSPLALRALVTH
ncbi:MAG TPA: LuxR C-terminal-related transcriptional regulator [Candidatus Acidoferrum sp.]|nr:LuxR C-terminal-related transcriptional regulator [Candidatus Acidoferrum sp.]